MSPLAISVQRMLFQFRVNQGENENLTGLYYLYTETLLYSCCDQQPALIMHTHKHLHAKTYWHIFCIHRLLDILYDREDSFLYSYYSIFLYMYNLERRQGFWCAQLRTGKVFLGSIVCFFCYLWFWGQWPMYSSLRSQLFNEEVCFFRQDF